jgi:hypothetical protein
VIVAAAQVCLSSAILCLWPPGNPYRGYGVALSVFMVGGWILVSTVTAWGMAVGASRRDYGHWSTARIVRVVLLPLIVGTLCGFIVFCVVLEIGAALYIGNNF